MTRFREALLALWGARGTDTKGRLPGLLNRKG